MSTTPTPSETDERDWTLRDDIWHTTLLNIVDTPDDPIRVSDIKTKASHHTVRRVFRALERYGWLERESDQSGLWYRGPLARCVVKTYDEAHVTGDELRELGPDLHSEA